LETHYKQEKSGSDCFLALKFFEYEITDNKPIMDQVHEIQMLISKLSATLDEVKELVVMVSNIQIGMITELNMATNVVKTSDWWLDSSATVHVCNNKAWFKTYEELKKPEEV